MTNMNDSESHKYCQCLVHRKIWKWGRTSCLWRLRPTWKTVEWLEIPAFKLKPKEK